MRDAPTSLLPDFRPRPLVVRPPVGLVVVLVRVEIFLRLTLNHLTRDQLRPVRPPERVRLDDLRAVDSKDSLALYARILRQAERNLVSERRPDHRISYPRIAARRI